MGTPGRALTRAEQRPGHWRASSRASKAQSSSWVPAGHDEGRRVVLPHKSLRQKGLVVGFVHYLNTEPQHSLSSEAWCLPAPQTRRVHRELPLSGN